MAEVIVRTLGIATCAISTLGIGLALAWLISEYRQGRKQ